MQLNAPTSLRPRFAINTSQRKFYSRMYNQSISSAIIANIVRIRLSAGLSLSMIQRLYAYYRSDFDDSFAWMR